MGKKKKVRFNNNIEKYFRWPIFYILVICTLTVIGALRDIELGIIFFYILLISFGVGIYIISYTKKHFMSEVINFALDFNGIQNDFMNRFEVPNALLDSSGRIRWFNENFEIVIDDDKILDKNINGVIPQFSTDILPSENEERLEKIIEIEDKVYRAVITYLKVEKTQEPNAVVDINYKSIEVGQVLYTLYLFDITKENELTIKNEEQKAVVGLLYIDNYEEVINSIEDVRRPLLIALIDRNISKFARQIDGVLRKFEKDKYLIVFQNKYLQKLNENKFSVLDQIRDINIGNELPVTLSIGIGINEYSYSQCIDFARVAIDLALGRGGDQAVIKNNDKFSFYGGKTRGIETSTRVKARIKAYAFRELIEECDKVIIMGHKLQDLDSLGAAIGIYSCARLYEKKAHIIISDITTTIKALYDQILEIDRYPDDLFVTGQEAVSYITDQTLLVVVDVNRPSYTEYPDIIKYVKNVVVFDHHRVGPEHIENPVLSYVEPYASSTCEMVTEILRYISDKIKLETIEADALFAGITVDTKNFAIKTGVKTFEAAAFLRRNGADVVRVRKFFKNDMQSYKAKATAVRDAEIYKDNMAISICPSDVSNSTLVAAQAADELLNIAGIKASFVLTEVGETIYISARSLDDINVQLIMEKLGGGGHLSVAGAQLKDYTKDGAIEILKETIDEYLEEGEA